MQQRSEQLEKEAEQIRAQLADSIEELRQKIDALRRRLSPSKLVIPLLGAGSAWFTLKIFFPTSSKDGLAAGGSGYNPISDLVGFLSHRPILVMGLGAISAAAISAFLPAGEIDASLGPRDATEKAGQRSRRQTAAAAEREAHAKPITASERVALRAGVAASR